MGDSLKWAAEEERREWESSQKYKDFIARKEKYKKLLAKLRNEKLSNFTLGDIEFLMEKPKVIGIYGSYESAELDFYTEAKLLAIEAVYNSVMSSKPTVRSVSPLNGGCAGDTLDSNAY